MRLNERVKRLQAASKASAAPGTESIEETYRWIQEVLSQPDTEIPLPDLERSGAFYRDVL